MCIAGWTVAVPAHLHTCQQLHLAAHPHHTTTAQGLVAACCQRWTHQNKQLCAS
jgi:hypothetical protein